MSPTSTLPEPAAPIAPKERAALAASGLLRGACRQLETALGQPLALLDVRSGTLHNSAAARLGWDLASRSGVLEEISRRESPEIVEHESPLSMIAIPLSGLERGAALVAVGVFLTGPAQCEVDVAAAARVFGVDAGRVLAWSRDAEPWTAGALLRVAETTLANIVQRSRIEYLEHEIHEAAAHARDSYAELGLFHRLTRGLALSDDDGQLWSRAAEWLSESVPAECVAIVPRSSDADALARCGERAPEVIHGACPISSAELSEMMVRLGPAAQRPLLLNRAHTAAPTWAYPTVRELAAAPILDGRRLEGWLLAINHSGAPNGASVREFGSAEIRLLKSVSAILGVHRSNAGLFYRQADLFGAAVRALISAIDAKDQYTHGHSERVARVAVCLAEELHLSKSEINTLYLGGLLHDIGKIGIDDAVLNKPGALTADEFAQVKQHPQLGHDILQGVRQLERILPIVLHHHEAWNGAGYPHGLAGSDTPLLARVTAVADAFDAMSSDRPYRPGMTDEKLDAILRDGAGRQWDPLVIDAFFAARDKIRQASLDAMRERLPLDTMSWVD